MLQEKGKEKKGKRYFSIKSHLMIGFALFMFITATIVIVTVYMHLDNIIQKNVSRNLTLLSNNQGMELDQIMFHIESQVSEMSAFIENYGEDSSDLKDPAMRRQLFREIESVFTSSTGNNEFAFANYVFFNPEYTGGKQDGFLYMRDFLDRMIKIPLTDISKYDKDDIEHVGWFYIPKENGYPTWIEPYHNKNLDIFMVSYVIPVYRDNEFICIVGMDINFRKIVEHVDNMITSDGTRSYICSTDNDTFYIPSPNSAIREVSSNRFDFGKNKELLNNKSSMGELISFKENGTDKLMAFVSLKNNMKLIVYNDLQTLYADKIKVTNFIIFLMLLAGSVFVIYTFYNSKSIVSPLKKLTRAALDIGEGRTKIDFPDSNITEIRILTDAFIQTNDQLKEFRRKMSTMAFQDELTKVKNKASYVVDIETIQSKIEKQEKLEFAVVMCDLNFLKPINDTYGHEAGDIAVKKCASIICGVFQHSPVYRIGGDEFAVILTDKSYEERKHLEQKLDVETYRKKKTAEKPYEAISIAHGMAIYNPNTDNSYRDVFERADQAMYKNKAKWHNEKGVTPR
ncbi:diguanylate cyclase domain-containing protein [Lachnospiraceae bacterium C1.1]|nr:diguanylate cyclase [Lachnospiraceae bacterium C1.1]